MINMVYKGGLSHRVYGSDPPWNNNYLFTNSELQNQKKSVNELQYLWGDNELHVIILPQEVNYSKFKEVPLSPS